MAHSGYMPTEELKTLRKFGSRLQGHPHREFMPWLETSSGPLGEGLSQGVGMAIADKINNKYINKFIYCFLGDGELNEGNIWEAVMLAGKNKLNNLIAIVDRNNIQIDGNTEDIMPLEPLAKKWESFNWHVIKASGHDFASLNDALESAHKITDKPIVILAETIASKGIKAWEGDYRWHGKAPSKEEAIMALKELDNL
jgi:transketolase